MNPADSFKKTKPKRDEQVQIAIRMSDEAAANFSHACRQVGERKNAVVAAIMAAIAELPPATLAARAPREGRAAPGDGMDKMPVFRVLESVETAAAAAVEAAGLDLSTVLRIELARWSFETNAAYSGRHEELAAKHEGRNGEPEPMALAAERARATAQRYREFDAYMTSDESLKKIQAARDQALTRKTPWSVTVVARMFGANPAAIKRLMKLHPQFAALIELKAIDIEAVEDWAAEGKTAQQIADLLGLDLIELEARGRRTYRLGLALRPTLDGKTLWAGLAAGTPLREASEAAGMSLLRLSKLADADPLALGATQVGAIEKAFAEITKRLGALPAPAPTTGGSLFPPIAAAGDYGAMSADESESIWARTTEAFAARLFAGVAEGFESARADLAADCALQIARRIHAQAEEAAARTADVVARLERNKSAQRNKRRPS